MDISAWTEAAALLGAGLCMGLGAFGAAVGEGRVARATTEAMARQPAAHKDILHTMLMGQAVAESAAIFALVVAILLITGDYEADPLRAMAFLSAGLCMGAGAIGPGLGGGLPAEAAVKAIGRNPRLVDDVTTTMLLSQAVAQTPAVFALMIALLLIYGELPAAQTLSALAALLAAGISTGAGGIGPGIGAGVAGEKAVEAAARRPHARSVILRAMLTGQAVTQSTAIYALLVSLVLLFVL